MAIEVVNKSVSYQGSASQTKDSAETADSDHAERAASSGKTASSEQDKISVNETADTGKSLQNATDKSMDKESITPMTASTEALKKAVDEINKHTKNTEAIFGIHDETNRVVIKIVDKDSKKIIREYPPEETLDMIAKVWEMAGIMIDEKG